MTAYPQSSMNRYVITGFLWLVWMQASALVCGQPKVSSLTISPRQPREGSEATLRCQASGFDPDIHEFLWQRFGSPTWIDVVTDDKITISPVNPITGLSTLYYQTATIRPLWRSDSGIYMCTIIQSGSGVSLADKQETLTVHSAEPFPICSPDGPAVVEAGDTLSCRTASDVRTLRVSVHGDANPPPNLFTESSDPGESESELFKTVSAQDDGLTFLCASSDGTQQQLFCRIGPLTLPLNPTDRQPSSRPPLTAAPCPDTNFKTLGIAGIVVAVIVVFVTIGVSTLCCRYDPRRWRQLIAISTRPGLSSREHPPTSDEIDSHTTSHGLPSTYANISAYPGTSSKTKEHTNYEDVDESRGGRPMNQPFKPESPSTDRSTKLDGDPTSNPSDPYMELNTQDNKSALYTELQI